MKFRRMFYLIMESFKNSIIDGTFTDYANKITNWMLQISLNKAK